jgi:hypothetical protein
VQRQQFRKMVLEHEAKLLVLRSLGPFSGKPVAQAGVGDLRRSSHGWLTNDPPRFLFDREAVSVNAVD